MKVFISGGCKNGKSLFAQRLAKLQENNKGLYYLATMIPTDSEDLARIDNHRKEREGWGFETVEIRSDIKKSVFNCDKGGSFLLDSVTALLANEMFKNGHVNEDAYMNVANDLFFLSKEIKNIVIVSDYIYSNAEIFDSLTDKYKKGLAYIDRTIANVCDIVLECCYGSIIIHKGRSLIEGDLRFKEILCLKDF